MSYELEFNGDIEDYGMQFLGADADADYYVMGDVDINELNAMEGAPAEKIAKAVKGKLTKTASKKPDAPTSAVLRTPGTALVSSAIPPVSVSGAKVKHPGTMRKLSGNLLKWNVDAAPVVNPFLSVVKTAPGQSNPNDPTVITFDDSDKPSGCAIYSVPMMFLSISASQLNARLGNRYTLKVEGKTRDGVALTSDSWLFEREHGDKAVRILYIPYARQNDTIVPVTAAFGDIGGTGADEALTVTMTGVADTEAVQVILPGLDSTDYADFLRQWGLDIVR